MRISDWSSDVCSSDLLKADALGLAHQPVDLLKGLGDFLKLGEMDARQFLRLVELHIRLVLKRLVLIVDLVGRAGGSQQVLAVVAGVEDNDRLCRRGGHGQAHEEGPGGGGTERARDQTFAGEETHHITPLLGGRGNREVVRSEEHTSELQSLMRISYAVFCLKKKNMNSKQIKYS